jgi:23S rRNA pseudouridine1911/1915/1917 synthase
MKFEAGPEDRGTRLDIFLTHFFEDLTRSRLQSMNRRGAILVNGYREKAGYRLQTGDIIQLTPPTVEPFRLEPEPIPLEVHYEDRALAIIEKPAGMVVHPGSGNRGGTLANALKARFIDLSDAGGPIRPGIVHRLDKWTSGLILIAKTNDAHYRLSRSFEKREVRKSYRALVHGRLSKETGKVELSIGRHPSARTRMAVRSKGGRTALSDYRVLERSASFSLLEVRILTGRTHQIRVHLNAIGHPVVGDTVYGEKRHRAFVRRWGKFHRYFLHASDLAFPHPLDGTSMAFHSPLPPELEELWQRLKGSA